jgi:hypothetical protein
MQVRAMRNHMPVSVAIDANFFETPKTVVCSRDHVTNEKIRKANPNANIKYKMIIVAPHLLSVDATIRGKVLEPAPLTYG